MRVSGDGKPYYQNEIEQRTQWEPPSESVPQPQQPPQPIATNQVQLTVGTNTHQGTPIGAVASNQMQYAQHGQQPPMPQQYVQSQQQVVIMSQNGQPQLRNVQQPAQEKAHHNIGLDAPKKRTCCVACLGILWGTLVPIVDVLVSIGTLITTIIVWGYAQSKDNVGGICCGLIYSGEESHELTDYADGCTWDNIAENGMVYTNTTDGIAYCMTNEGVVCNQGIVNEEMTLPGPENTETITSSIFNITSSNATLEQCMIDGGYTIMDVCDPDDMNRWYNDAQAIILPLLGVATVGLILFFLCASIADLFGRNSKASIKEVFYKGCCCPCYRFICCMFCIPEDKWEKGMKMYGWMVFKICCWVPPFIFAMMVDGMFGNRFFNIYGNAENVAQQPDHPERKIFNADPGFIYSSAICAGDGSTVYVDYSQSPLVVEGAWIMNINDQLGLFGLIRTSVGLAMGVILGLFCKQGFGDLELNEILDLL